MAGYPDKASSAIEGRVTPVHHAVTEGQRNNLQSRHCG
jgi:hypothetical protein